MDVTEGARESDWEQGVTVVEAGGTETPNVLGGRRNAPEGPGDFI